MKNNARISTATLRRGQRHAGGLYVGTTAAGVVWVARKNATYSESEAFAVMCARFDILHMGAPQ